MEDSKSYYKDDSVSLSKISELSIRFDEFIKRFERFETSIQAELSRFGDRLEKIESLRERLAQLESTGVDLSRRVSHVEDAIQRSLRESNDFLKKITWELFAVVLGIITSLLLTFFKK